MDGEFECLKHGVGGWEKGGHEALNTSICPVMD